MQKNNGNPKSQRIIRWRETMATLSDDRFFEIMRIYIGEIHTPFNKNKLIEQLSAILRKEQNKERIISYLSPFDIKMISAISAIENATKEKLTDFFKNEYAISDIYSELLNLNERLIIYSHRNDRDETILEINPLLEDSLQPYINVAKLLPEPVFAEHNFDAPFALTPQFIAAFLSYVYENPEMCRNNNSLKKRDAERLEQIFPGKAETLELLLKGLINLKLIRQGEKFLSIDEKRIDIFARNSELRQYAFLSVAAAVRLGREGLRNQTQLLLDVAASIPATGLSKSSLLRAAFLINSRAEDPEASPVQGRFSRMLQNHGNSFAKAEYSGQIEEQIIENAIEFGIFAENGKTEKGEQILIPGALLQNGERHLTEEMKKGILNINAGTTIAILPGLTLLELFPFVLFMNVIKCSTITEFEITRKSISRAFDKNISKEQILNLLSTYNAYKIPQSLEMNIEEWFSSYSSAVLYKGYVLKVDEKQERVIENNPKIAGFIQTKLASGLYLLNIPLDQDTDEFIRNSGIEFMGNVKTPCQDSETINYPLLKNGTNYFLGKQTDSAIEEKLIEINRQTEEFKKSLLAKLETMEMTKQQREGLETRINRNVILSEDQLLPETVKMEILEADGMNYAGKIHLLENAIQGGDLVEFTIPNERDSSIMEKFLGQPLMVAKQANDSLVKLAIQNDSESTEIRVFSVSRANRIKIIRTSLFR